MQIVEMTSWNINIQMNFSEPLNVSTASLRDLLQVEIWNKNLLLTKVNRLPVQLSTRPLQSKIPRQSSGTKFELTVTQVIESVGDVAKAGTVVTGVLTIFLSIGLSQILGMMQGISLICCLACIRLVFPAVLQTFMSKLLEFATFDIIDTKPIFEKVFG